MNIESNHIEIMELAQQLGNIAVCDPAARWQTFHRLSFQLYAQLARSPFILDCIATAAYGQIGAADMSPVFGAQIEWDELADKEARVCADVLRAVGFTPCDVLEIHKATDISIGRISRAAKRLTHAGIVYSDESGRLNVSPIGAQVAKYFEDNPDAIRPPAHTRILNRRRA